MKENSFRILKTIVPGKKDDDLPVFGLEIVHFGVK